jgi:transketolase
MELPTIFVFTHDAMGDGEDGPTHQPVEHLASYRAMPNFTLFRPADAAEATEAWRWAMTHVHGPTAIVCSRQKLLVLDRSALGSADGTRRGAYVLADAESGEPDAILIATGSEVEVALAARGILAEEGIDARVVSMPSWEVFADQDEEYRESVLPSAVTARVSIEAAATFGWERWIGERGIAIGVDRFGASAPGEVLLREFGITAGAAAEAASRLVKAAAPR